MGAPSRSLALVVVLHRAWKFWKFYILMSDGIQRSRRASAFPEEEGRRDYHLRQANAGPTSSTTRARVHVATLAPGRGLKLDNEKPAYLYLVKTRETPEGDREFPTGSKGDSGSGERDATLSP